MDQEIYNEILSRFEKIKLDAGVEPDEEYRKQIDGLLGISLSEIEEEIFTAAKTQTIGIELIHKDSIFPSYAYPSDSGFDLFSTEEVIIPPFGRALVPTGIKVSFNEGYEIQIRPKSGLAINQGLTVLNTPGTVDFQYSGEIKVIVFNTNNATVTLSKGMKVAQAVLCPVINGKFVNLKRIKKIEDRGRGNNGFGSTGI